MASVGLARASSFSALALSYVFGCIFGRWDIRYAIGTKAPPELVDPFVAVPVCSPGMLQRNDGLPLLKPPEGYPISTKVDGIVADDPDHAADIVRRVRNVIEVIWKDRAEATEREACEILGVSNLRDYFRKPGAGGFWDDHVKRYSMSRRKAPIYWLLQSSNLWIYYHRLDKDILFKALLNYVEPKTRKEESSLNELRSQKTALGPAAKGAKKIDKDIDRQESFLSELRDFEDKLRRAADLHLEPDLNDGVVLNIAPLHELVPWKEAKKYWEELLEGKYEWSSIGKQLREKGLVKCWEGASTSMISGPAPTVDIELSDRLNIFTGDNGLGKSFILDIAWWALTGTWAGLPAWPRRGGDVSPRIEFQVIDKHGRGRLRTSSRFDFPKQMWTRKLGRPVTPGLVVYARVDGGFSVWDPARSDTIFRTTSSHPPSEPFFEPFSFHFSPKTLWNGLAEADRTLCNGLTRDWVIWQVQHSADQIRHGAKSGGDDNRPKTSPFEILKGLIEGLVATPGERVGIGTPIRLSAIDVTDYPTLTMTHGDVPLVIASAGIKRILSLCLSAHVEPGTSTSGPHSFGTKSRSSTSCS